MPPLPLHVIVARKSALALRTGPQRLLSVTERYSDYLLLYLQINMLDFPRLSQSQYLRVKTRVFHPPDLHFSPAVIHSFPTLFPEEPTSRSEQVT